MRSFQSMLAGALLCFGVLFATTTPSAAQVLYSYGGNGDGSITFYGPDGDVTVRKRNVSSQCGYGGTSWQELISVLRQDRDGQIMFQTHTCGRGQRLIRVCVAINQEFYDENSPDICYVASWKRSGWQ